MWSASDFSALDVFDNRSVSLNRARVCLLVILLLAAIVLRRNRVQLLLHLHWLHLNWCQRLHLRWVRLVHRLLHLHLSHLHGLHLSHLHGLHLSHLHGLHLTHLHGLHGLHWHRLNLAVAGVYLLLHRLRLHNVELPDRWLRIGLLRIGDIADDLSLCGARTEQAPIVRHWAAYPILQWYDVAWLSVGLPLCPFLFFLCLLNLCICLALCLVLFFAFFFDLLVFLVLHLFLQFCVATGA